MEFPLQLAAEVQRNALAALVEDIGGGDLTALLIPATRRSQGIVISREDAVLAGSGRHGGDYDKNGCKGEASEHDFSPSLNWLPYP